MFAGSFFHTQILFATSLVLHMTAFVLVAKFLNLKENLKQIGLLVLSLTLIFHFIGHYQNWVNILVLYFFWLLLLYLCKGVAKTKFYLVVFFFNLLFHVGVISIQVFILVFQSFEPDKLLPVIAWINMVLVGFMKSTSFSINFKNDNIKNIGILKFFNYMFYFPSFFTGPFYEYNSQFKPQDTDWKGILKNTLVAVSSIYFSIVISSISLEDGMVLNAKSITFVLCFPIFAYVYGFGFTRLCKVFSGVLGIQVEDQFNRPWLAKNFIELFQRWTCTYRKFFIDYIFIPFTMLLSSMTKLPRFSMVISLFFVFTLMGVFHVPSWGSLVDAYLCATMVLCSYYFPKTKIGKSVAKNFGNNKYFIFFQRLLTFLLFAIFSSFTSMGL